MLSCFSRVQLCVILWTVAQQAPRPWDSPGKNNWSGLPCPPPGNLRDPGIELVSLMSSALAGKFFTTSTTWEAQMEESDQIRSDQPLSCVRLSGTP